MILGRPTNLVLAAFTAVFNVVVLIVHLQGIDIEAELVAGVNIAAAAVIGLIANQPPTVNSGDTVTWFLIAVLVVLAVLWLVGIRVHVG
jgi:hypothetical protein